MLNHAESVLPIDSRRAVRSIAPALLASLTVHAALGVAVLHVWQRMPVVPPQPLTVTLVEAEPPRPVAVVSPATVRKPSPPPALPQTAPVVQPVATPAPVPMAVERSAAIPVASVPVVETPVAPPASPKVAVAPVAAPRAEVVEPPHFNVAYLNNPRPAYPPMARRLGIEGLVVLRVQVSAKGVPEQVAVAQSSGQTVLDEAALRAVQGWSFVPARLGDKPIAHAVDVPVRFQLKN